MASPKMDETDLPPPGPPSNDVKPAPATPVAVSAPTASSHDAAHATGHAAPTPRAQAATHGGHAHTDAGGPAHATQTFSRWRVARAAGAGAASALVLAMGLSGPGSLLHEGLDKMLQFAFAGAILVIVGISIVEPFLAWLHHGDHHADPHAGRPWRRTIATLIIVLLTFLFVAVDGLLHETLAKVNSQFIGNWLGSFVSAAVVTYAWARGVYRGPPFATIYGTLTALLAMFFMWLVILGLYLLGALAESERITFAAVVNVIVGFSTLWGMAMVVWFLCGLLGGLALDFGRGLPSTWRVAIVVFLAWAIYTIAIIRLTDEPRTWIADLSRGLGWGLGLLFYRPSERALSTRSKPYTPSWLAVFLAFVVGAATSIMAAIVLLIGGAMLERAIVVGEKTYMGSHKAAVAKLDAYEHERFLVTFAHNRGGQLLDKDDFAIRFWDHRESESYRSLLGHTDEVLDVREIETEHPPGLLSIGRDNTMRRWNVDRGMEDEVRRIEFKPRAGFRAAMARIHPEQEIAAIVGEDGTILFFDASIRGFSKTIEPSGKIVGIEWADEEHLVAAMESGEVLLIPSGEHGQTMTLGKHGAAVTSLAISSNRRYAATGDASGVINLWGLQSRSQHAAMGSVHTPIKSVAVNSDASRVLYGSVSDEVVLLSADDEKPLATFSHPGVPTSLKFLKYWHIATAGGDGGIRVFRVPR